MSLQPGQQIGDYQVLEVLGAGGMGQVYKVRNVISDRTEAMKVLLPDLQRDPGLADRFLREIKVQASLEHPNIARLHTALRADNQLLMLMEFVEGRTLDKFIEQGQPMPLAHAVWYCIQVLGALDYAHARGIVHRDIKPANMMLTSAGELKLLDFGIARVMNDPSLTQTRQTVGSLYYMSPEQINGQNVDSRSDLYSLGVSLYQMVTGRKPFDGTSDFSIMAAHLQQAAIPPMQMDPRMPQSLNDVILTAIAKDTAQRFQTATAFRGALETVFQQLQGQPASTIDPATAPTVGAQPVAPTPAHGGFGPDPATPAPPPSSGPRLGLILGLAALFLVLFAAGTFFYLRAKRQNAEMAKNTEGTESTPPVITPKQDDPPPVTSTDPNPTTPNPPKQDPPKQDPPRQQNHTAVPVPRTDEVKKGPPPATDPPVQQNDRATSNPVTASANVPTTTPEKPKIDPTLIREFRTRRSRIEARLETCKSAFAAQRESLAQQGLKPRGDLQVLLRTVEAELSEGEASLQLGVFDEARQHYETAEQALRRVEKAFNF